MKNTVVLYQSKYGATERYAKWLSASLNGDLVKTKAAKIADIEKYDTIILCGGIYASGIAGLSFFKKNYQSLNNKKLAVLAVGASPYDEKAMSALIAHNFKNGIAAIPCFYCRGAWRESEMTFKDKLLCNMLKTALSKKDVSDYEVWEKALMQAIGNDADWTDEKNLLSLLEYVNE